METEKIEIMNFDQEGYLKDGASAVEAGWKLVEMADRVHEEGYDAIFLLGIGGTWDELMQLEYMMNKYGDDDLQVYLLNAAEWNIVGHKAMTSNSVVFTASESGTTPEVLEAVKKMRAEGIRVIAMTDPNGLIGQAVGADRCVEMASNHGSGGCEKGYFLADCFGLRLLNRRGTFDKFDLFMEQSKGVWQDLLDIRKKIEPKAEAIAKKYANADYTMFIASGALWGETILYSMCLLEEMQWKRTRHVTSADFFHGTLELVEPGVPVFLFKGVDEYRKLDNRVEAFLLSGRTQDEDIVIIDIDEFSLPSMDPCFKTICSPWILSVIATDRFTRNYEMVTKHNLKYRRYYHQFDY